MYNQSFDNNKWLKNFKAASVQKSGMKELRAEIFHQTVEIVNSGGYILNGKEIAVDTENAKDFPQVWAEIEPKIADLPLVAHNSQFEKSRLKEVFRVYQMDYPDYEFYCTLSASRKTFGKLLPNHQLHTVAAHCGYNLKNHHHALADAEACAVIAMKIFAP